MPVVQMRGDSMGDTLGDGDFVIVETGHTDVAQGGIFAVLEDNESVIITQVEMTYQAGHSTGRIRCTPRNPAYTPFELTLGDDAKIIGRVAQRITRYL
jgi:phage repressor protein C with HTH and peptisase S24 domain